MQNANTYQFEQVDGRPGITCLVCGRTSFHPTDVAERYCGYCKIFHEAVAAGFEQFLLGEDPPDSVIAVWVDQDNDNCVLCLWHEDPPRPGNMALGVLTAKGWQRLWPGDWIMTLISGERTVWRQGRPL